MVQIILTPAVLGFYVKDKYRMDIDIEDDDKVRDIKNKISEKISEKIGGEIYSEDFRLVNTYGEKLNSSNLEDFKEEAIATIVSDTFNIEKLFGSKKPRKKENILVINTDQYILSIKNLKITRNEVNQFIFNKKKLVLKGYKPGINTCATLTLSYYEDDLIEFKLVSRFINLSFHAEIDTIRSDLEDYLDRHDL